ncbi:hypothetical protein CFOL_v3_33302 [Cephalotus follicularis]|uniref:Uncharacterized protein n=1 Tax=Cephalotus follicularis TaxID=3775 RepID=A0A1Q3DBR7_CEPFO|nr:hypothetical protein CFOL_v3_33302 [Cephalotus follicularis]
MELLNSKKRSRPDPIESEPDISDVKRLREDLLGISDDSDVGPSSFQDLDSIMKSFEEEITASPVPVVDLTSDSGESQPELGYLLEASDDELGLPPAMSSEELVKSGETTELVRVETDSSGFGDLWGFEDQIASYDSFELGMGDNYSEFVVYDEGLFGYSDVCFGSTEVSNLSWRFETQQAEQ